MANPEINKIQIPDRKISADLLKWTEVKIDSNKALMDFTEKARTDTICLFPETVSFNQSELKYGVAVVSVDTTNLVDGNNRDIYSTSNGYALHLNKLNEIAQTAGIRIIDSRISERQTDENGRVILVIHTIKWQLKSVDGSIKEGEATGKYDYYADQDSKTDKQTKQRRKHAEALAESNARVRAFNMASLKLQNSYSLAELKKPFLIPFVIEDKNELLKDLPAEMQIELKKQVAMKKLGLLDTMYPGAPKQIENASYEEVDKTTGEIKQLPGKEIKPAISAEEENHINAETFREATQKERTEKIMRLVQLKEFKSEKPVTPGQIEKSSLDKQIAFIEKLLNIPDGGEGELPE